MPATEGVTVNGIRVRGDQECYCVSRHVPTYAYVLPWTLPDGHILYLCPNTHHSTGTLLKIMKEIGGKPPPQVLYMFSVVATRLAIMHYRMEKEGLSHEHMLSAAKLKRLQREV